MILIYINFTERFLFNYLLATEPFLSWDLKKKQAIRIKRLKNMLHYDTSLTDSY
jgi:hypothetical protein